MAPETLQQPVFKWSFQLDDSKSLHEKWMFHQTSISNWLFGVPGDHYSANIHVIRVLVGVLKSWLLPVQGEKERTERNQGRDTMTSSCNVKSPNCPYFTR